MEEKKVRLWRHAIIILLDLLGTLLALYVGGVLMFALPLYHMVTDLKANTLTSGQLIRSVISILLASTSAGGIWCIFDILASLFREKED